MRSTPPHLSACALPPAFTTQDKTVLGIMTPTLRPNNLGSSNLVVSAIAVGPSVCKIPIIISKELSGPFPAAAHFKVKDNAAPGSSAYHPNFFDRQCRGIARDLGDLRYFALTEKSVN